MQIPKRLRSGQARVLLAVLLVLILAVGFVLLPPIYDRLAWRVDALRSRIAYFFNPPDQAVFQPEETADFDSVLATTRAEYAAALTPEATSTSRPGPTPTPTVTSTPLPAAVELEGVKYEHQHNRWNYCGPANFSMSLTFWGWKGDRDVIGKAIKPSDKDKNVMPYELVDYVTDEVTGMSALQRYGGDIETLKRLLAAGFPVVAEKGYYERDYTGKMGWMGHYQFVTGYDDITGTLLVQDTYLDGPNFSIPYDEFMEGWRAFNYLFVVTYPTEREGEVLTLLGPLADANTAAQRALERAQAESETLDGIDRFFAYFNIGSSHVAMQQYADATYAYDFAFQLYAGLTGDNSIRPYRMMWYQTGPYFAYFYSNRYADVINLATTTLEDTISEPVLEESLVWRGRAYYMAGKTEAAIADYRAALKVHPNWPPAVQA
ncbi:MAG: C39 family peptidase, partial [Chloroflexota bacterium]